MIKRLLLAMTAVSAFLVAAPSAPASAISYPQACSDWRQSGGTELRGCARDLLNSTVLHEVSVRNLSTKSKKVDLRVQAWVNGQLVRTCTWNDVTLPGSGFVERSCTTTRIKKYEYRTKAAFRSSVGASQWVNQLTGSLVTG